jgi:hypothetical protein
LCQEKRERERNHHTHHLSDHPQQPTTAQEKENREGAPSKLSPKKYPVVFHSLGKTNWKNYHVHKVLFVWFASDVVVVVVAAVAVVLHSIPYCDGH